MTTPAPRYRPDIDGLRAVAVLAVVLFHAGSPGFSGGYVGVDIFFVISGYLITRNIVVALDRDRFSLKGFYIRRFRRLFPALMATLLASTFAAIILFQPEHLLRFGQELLAALFSVSNIYFWKVSGYFDIDAGYKALLHTWSLAIEEQFYLLWPALLLLLSLNRSKHLALVVIAIGSVLSLILAEYWMADQQATAFYWLPARVFEFGVGAALVWWRRPTWLETSPRVAEGLYIVGLMMIAWAIVRYDYLTAFPGLNALLPCLGAGLLIFAGHHARSSRLLSNRPMVGIGLISYSVYLVHWPLIVFYSYWRFVAVSGLEMAALVLASIGVGALMWRFVEQPFRRPRQPAQRAVAGGVLALSLTGVTVIAALAMWHGQGWSWRFDSGARFSAQQIEMGMRDRFQFSNKACRLDQYSNPRRCDRDAPIQVLFIGDSHEVDAFNVWTFAFGDRPGMNLILFGNANHCDVTQQAGAHSDPSSRCTKKAALLRDPTFVARLDAVVYGASVPFSPTQLPRYLPLFEQMEQHNPDLQWVVVGGYLKLRRDCSFIYNTFGDLTRCSDPNMLLHDSRQERAQQQAQATSLARFDPLIINKVDLLCAPSERCAYGIDGQPFAWDAHHLSLPFAKHLGGLVADRYGDRLLALGAVPSDPKDPADPPP